MVCLAFLFVSNRFLSIIAVVLAFSSGLLLSACRSSPIYLSEQQIQPFYNHEVVISGQIAKDLSISESKIGITLQDVKISTGDREIELTAKFYISLKYLSTDLELRRSDYISVQGKLQPGFGNFLASMYRPEIISVERPTPGDFFLTLRDNFADKIKSFIDEPESSLGLGYLLGMRNGVDEDFLELLRVVGLTHIIVASGTHLSILASFAKKGFGKISRFAGFSGACLMILVFVGITGLTPSMTRAAFVSIMGLIAWYFGRDRSGWRILLMAIMVTLIYNPANLTDLAWLLSFGSFGGIMVFSPILSRFFFGPSEPGFIASSIITSLAASILCTPVLIYFFGIRLAHISGSQFVNPSYYFIRHGYDLSGRTFF